MFPVAVSVWFVPQVMQDAVPLLVMDASVGDEFSVTVPAESATVSPGSWPGGPPAGLQVDAADQLPVAVLVKARGEVAWAVAVHKSRSSAMLVLMLISPAKVEGARHGLTGWPPAISRPGLDLGNWRELEGAARVTAKDILRICGAQTHGNGTAVGQPHPPVGADADAARGKLRHVVRTAE